MDTVLSGTNYIVAFLVVLTILVFVHEMGHYLVARWCGVRVEVFSVGFGPEIFGRTDGRGTRWKISAIPFGGYVKMFGEQVAADGEAKDDKRPSPQDEAVSFHNKSLLRRSAIIVAGPAANFLFAIVVLGGIFTTIGEPFTPADITGVVSGSAADRAGFKPGDLIKSINGTRIERFEEVVRIVRLAPGSTLRIVVERDGQRLSLTAMPDIVEQTNRFGMRQVIGQLGVSRSGGGVEIVKHDPATATWRAVVDSITMIGDIFRALGQMIVGTRDVSELGGPIRIAQISGDMWQAGLVSILVFVANLSINLGLINLFPIPMLDGGHLMFYAIEAVAGRPLGERAREYGFRIGIAMVFALMIFVTWNDLVQLRVFDLLVGLVT